MLTPPLPKFVAYFRVSTDKQGKSRLGLEAQQEAAARKVAAEGGTIIASFEEVESGKKNGRPALAKAMAACRVHRAVLIVAKLDRLARNTRFLLSIVEGTGEGGVVFCDLPEIPKGPVGKFMVTQLAAVAELEAGLISQRTKAAFAAAKARGRRLGNPKLAPGNRDVALIAAAAKKEQAAGRLADLAPIIADIQAAGLSSLPKIVKALKARGIPTLSGRGEWSTGTLHGVLAKLASQRPVA